MRPIDADALAMELCQARDSWTEDDDFEKGVRMGITRGINGAKHAPTIGGWIPVSKRLPKEGERILVTAALEHVMVAHYGKMFFEKERGNVFYLAGEDGDADITDVVVAWMPLPEPYREEGDQ